MDCVYVASGFNLQENNDSIFTWHWSYSRSSFMWSKRQLYMWSRNQMVHGNCILCCIWGDFNSLNLFRREKLCSFLVVVFLLNSLFYSHDVQAVYFCRMLFLIWISGTYILTHIQCSISLYACQLYLLCRTPHSCCLFSLSSRTFFSPRKGCMSQTKSAAFCWTPVVSSTGHTAACLWAHGNCLATATTLWHQIWLLTGFHCEMCPSEVSSWRFSWRDCGTYRGMNMLGPWLSSKSSTATVSKTQWLGMLLPCFCVTQLLYSSKNNYPLPQSFYSQYLSTFALPLQAKLKIVSFSVSTQISKILFQLFISNWGEKQTLFFKPEDV